MARLRRLRRDCSVRLAFVSGAIVTRLRLCVVGAAVVPVAVALVACQAGTFQRSQGQPTGVPGAAHGATTTRMTPNARATAPALHSVVRYVGGQPMPNVA